MSDALLGSLITAAASIVVGLIAFWGSRRNERRTKRAADTQRRIDGIGRDYAQLLKQHRKDEDRLRTTLEESRAREVQKDREIARLQRLVDAWLEKGA